MSLNTRLRTRLSSRMRSYANRKQGPKMVMRRVLLMLAIVGAFPMAAKGEPSVPKAERPRLTEMSEEEKFDATPRGRELDRLVKDMMAGKAGDPEIAAYKKKYGIDNTIMRSPEPP